MSYKTYVKLRSDGQINSHVVTAGPAPPGYTEVADPDEAKLVQRSQGRAIMDQSTGRIVSKRELVLQPSKLSIIADGVDTAEIGVSGGPVREGTAIRVHIDDGQIEHYLLPFGESLEISAKTRCRFVIMVDDPTFFAQPVAIEATEAP